jgi:hypothetical protein
MSTDWDVYCRTCNDGHGFSDANHQDELMHILIDHAAAIAALAPLVADQRYYTIELRTSWGTVSPDWFAQHLGHDLVARSEYGQYSERPNLPSKYATVSTMQESCKPPSFNLQSIVKCF